METKGIEQTALMPSKTTISKSLGAKCGAPNDAIIKRYPELVKLIQAWPTLPEQTRAEVKDLIEKHSTEETGKKGF